MYTRASRGGRRWAIQTDTFLSTLLAPNTKTDTHQHPPPTHTHTPHPTPGEAGAGRRHVELPPPPRARRGESSLPLVESVRPPAVFHQSFPVLPPHPTPTPHKNTSRPTHTPPQPTPPTKTSADQLPRPRGLGGLRHRHPGVPGTIRGRHAYFNFILRKTIVVLLVLMDLGYVFENFEPRIYHRIYVLTPPPPPPPPSSPQILTTTAGRRHHDLARPGVHAGALHGDVAGGGRRGE